MRKLEAAVRAVRIEMADDMERSIDYQLLDMTNSVVY